MLDHDFVIIIFAVTIKSIFKLLSYMRSPAVYIYIAQRLFNLNVSLIVNRVVIIPIRRI